MPFRLKNAGQTFQRFMDDILAVIPHVFIYLDDVEGGGHQQVPQAHHMLPTAELFRDDKLLQEVHQGGCQHPQAPD